MGVKIDYNYLGVKFNHMHPYLYRIGLVNGYTDEQKVHDWVDDMHIDCLFLGVGVYVKDEATLSLFILRWG